jgi:hypothetical protein
MRRMTRPLALLLAVLSALPAGVIGADGPVAVAAGSSTVVTESAAAPQTVVQRPATGTLAPEHPVKRFENVFFISLPFTALYSAILVIGTAAVIQVGIQKDSLRITIPYQAAAAGLACGASAWIAWHDHVSPPPEVSPAPLAVPAAGTSTASL